MFFGVKARLAIKSEGNCNIVEVLYNSIFAEVVSPANVGRIKPLIRMDNSCSLYLEVEADTLSHARAFINSILYLINASIETMNILEGYRS
ncbi:MAG: KEOPS complex subunit Pcc1 [Ignisphaera sp.]